MNFDGDMDDHAVEEIAAFKQLRVFDTLWEHLQTTVLGDLCILWRLLPRSFERLTLGVCVEELEVLEEVKGLAEAKEEGSVPKLKELVIRHEESMDRLTLVKRTLVDDAIREACRAASISVTQKAWRT